MIALFLALSLSPVPSPGQSALSAPTPDATQTLAATSAPAPAASDSQVAQLQALFDQSCAQRAYATYDDLCEALKDHIKSAQRAADKARRATPPTPASPVRNP